MGRCFHSTASQKHKNLWYIWKTQHVYPTHGNDNEIILREKKWCFFYVRNKKYLISLRTNRTIDAGYWKATRKDKEIFRGKSLVRMKKTIVFYEGRTPKGEKTNWIMHKYRLEVEFSLHNLPQKAKVFFFSLRFPLFSFILLCFLLWLIKHKCFSLDPMPSSRKLILPWYIFTNWGIYLWDLITKLPRNTTHWA